MYSIVAVKKGHQLHLGWHPSSPPSLLVLALSAAAADACCSATTHQPPPKLISDEIQDNEFISLKLRYLPTSPPSVQVNW